MTFVRIRLRRLSTAWLMAAVSIALCVATAPAQAAYPDQTIKLVVGFPPGGGGDLYARLIAVALQKSLGQTVIVENRPGAGGNIAANFVAKAPPDGYTLLLAMSGNLAVSPALRPEVLPYKVPDDFAMIGLMLEAPHGMFVAASSKYRSAAEVLQAARTNRMTIASTGTGGAAHIGMEMVKQKAGLQFVHVPYKGSGPAITDLMGGQIDLFFATAPPVMNQVRQGSLRLLAITGEKRNPAIPDVPTFRELGVDVVVTQWYGLAAPAHTPTAVLDLLSKHLSEALKTPEVRDFIRRDAAIEHDLPREQFRQYIVDDIARYRADVPASVVSDLKQ